MLYARSDVDMGKDTFQPKKHNILPIFEGGDIKTEIQSAITCYLGQTCADIQDPKSIHWFQVT